MTCSNPSGTSKGLVIGYGPADDGDRPVPAGLNPVLSPNIRFALPGSQPGQVNDLQANPGNWDQASLVWNGQVEVGSTYRLLVRVRNTDVDHPRASLNLQAWVSDYTAGGVGRASAILPDPTLPPGPGNNPISFTAFLGGPLPVGNPEDPADATRMLVMVSNESWTPNNSQLKINGGHVCVACNVWADATTNDDGSSATPVDGARLISGFIDPTCDRRYGQHNIMIILAPPGAHIQQQVMVFSAGQKLPPAAVEIIPAELVVGRDGQPDVPELQQAAEQLGLGQLRTGTELGDWFGQVGLGPGQSGELKVDPGTLTGPGTLNGSVTLPGVDGIDVIQAGRQRLEFATHSSPERHESPGQYATVTVDTTNRRPGDAFGFDITSTGTAGGSLGTARVYVLVIEG